jgi:hypothetical protein
MSGPFWVSRRTGAGAPGAGARGQGPAPNRRHAGSEPEAEAPVVDLPAEAVALSSRDTAVGVVEAVGPEVRRVRVETASAFRTPQCGSCYHDAGADMPNPYVSNGLLPMPT